MFTQVSKITAAAILAIGMAMPAQAAVTFGPTPTEAFANPVADSITGTVYQNFVGSIGGVRRSPWQSCGCGIDENDLTAFYTSVSRQSSATYLFAGLQSAVSFLWGSPDTYNDLDIILSGGAGTVTINGTEAFGTQGLGAQFVTIDDVGLFDSVTFRSAGNAFEFANLAATPSQVPVPAALPLLATAMAGMGYVGRKRRKTA